VKRALVIGAAATLIWVAVANSLPAKQARAAGWSRVKTTRTASGIAATYPRSWTAFARGPNTLAGRSRSLTPPEVAEPSFRAEIRAETLYLCRELVA
jgi:hypothetical protein